MGAKNVPTGGGDMGTRRLTVPHRLSIHRDVIDQELKRDERSRT
jgi:hypothetical protein